MHNGQSNQSFHQVMVCGVPTPLASGTFKDLAPEQIGLFAIDELGQISIATGSEDTYFQIAQGIAPFQAQGKAYGGGFSNAPRKTKEFKASDIIDFKGTKASREHRGQVVAIGYDGVDASKTITAMLDTKDLRIAVRLWGNLINKITGNSKDLKTYFYINKGCLGGCDINSTVAAEKIADSLIESMEKSVLTYGYKFSDLVQFKKIVKYAVDPSAPTDLQQFHKFQVEICDDGSSSALGLIQAQYPTLEVTRVNRLGSISTYEVWTKDTGNVGSFVTITPSAVSLSARTVAECEVCPAGSTKVDSVKAYELKGAIGASAPTIPSAVSTTLVGSTITQKTYIVVMADTASDATVITEASNDGYTARLLSTTRDICNFTATTYAWTSKGTATKAPKQWKITLADTACGTDRLAELQANYPGYTIAIDSTGTCAHTYTITNYSEPVEPGCYVDSYKFKAPSAFDGVNWVEFTTTLATPDCTTPTADVPCVAAGVILESKIEEVLKVDNYMYNYYGYDPDRIDPVHIEISVQSLDPASNLCEEPEYPITKLQGIKLPRGEGRWVIEKEVGQLNYELKRRSLNPIINQKFGYEFTAKDGKFYDEYQLKFKHTWNNGGWSQQTTDTYLVSFYFEEGQGKQFETLINGLIAKQGLKIKPVYL